MAQRQQVLVLTDGEKLTILIARDGRDIGDIALAWGKTRVQIWRYQNSEKLKPVVVKRACEVLGVPESIFDPRLNTDSLLHELDRMCYDILAIFERAAQQAVQISFKLVGVLQPQPGRNHFPGSVRLPGRRKPRKPGVLDEHRFGGAGTG